MKISIITVCKNAKNAIERTMLSVVSQNCFKENIEYVVIDGASTDKTAEIIKQYSNKYPIKWISEPDSGIYNAMNKGIKMATGEYLLFLNAGDYLVHYNVIKSLTNLFESSEFDVIYGNTLSINPISEESWIKATENPDIFFFFNDSLPHQAVFYKRTLFDKFGMYDETFKILADNVFNKKILCDEHASVKYTDQIISVFTQDGISSTNNKLRNEERKIFQKQCFSKEQLSEIKKQKDREEILKSRKEQKSILRFLAKIFTKLHEYWINR
jgi:glycosyltransferase involved in cell wall biosynthesis